MTDAPLRNVVRHLRRLAREDEGRRPTDGELLRAFLARDDQPAFTELVRRHGAMVLSVCRRVLQQGQDAEDAFQATFLLLARRAASVRKHESLGSWLHGVAFRAASHVRRATARRRKHEGRATPAPPANPAWGAAWREVEAILDEEIRQLPEHCRAAFVLCCLENQSSAEAARQLGVKEGTVWSRVAAARERLRQRLARRGVSLSAGLAAAAVSGNTAASAVPPALLGAAAACAAGASAVAAGCSARAAALADGMGRALTVSKVTAGAALVLLAAGLAAGLGLLPHPPEPVQPPAAAQPARAAEPGRPRTDLHGDPLPPDAVARLGTVRWRNEGWGTGFAVAPDGGTVATVAGKTMSVFKAPGGEPRRRIALPTHTQCVA